MLGVKTWVLGSEEWVQVLLWGPKKAINLSEPQIYHL